MHLNGDLCEMRHVAERTWTQQQSFQPGREGEQLEHNSGLWKIEHETAQAQGCEK